MVNNAAVERARLLQIGQRLPNRIGPLGAVNVVGGGEVSNQKFEVVVAPRHTHLRYFVGHEVGEYLFHPHIVEPAHGHEVAKPHVRCFMGNKRGAAQLLVAGSPIVEKQTRCPVLNSPDVFHAAVLKIGDGHEIELAERVFDLGIVLQKGQCIGVGGEDGV